MSDTFCPIPFKHLNIKTVGVVNACWRGYRSAPMGDYSKQNLIDIWNSKEYKELRLDLLNNKKPYHCNNCWLTEEQNNSSTRNRWVQKYEDKGFYQEYIRSIVGQDGSMPDTSLDFIEVRFDNTCNLMCRHCKPDYSTNWNVALKKDKEFAKELKQIDQAPTEIDDVMGLQPKNVDEIIQLAPNLKQINFAGGEPLYTPLHFELLEKLQPFAEHIEIEYNTNLHKLNYKNYDCFKLWKKFKKVTLRVSVDGEPSIYNYVRTNGKIENIIANIKNLHKYDNIGVMITLTASMYNMTRFIDILEFYTSLGGYFHTSQVTTPIFLDTQVLPKTQKQQITHQWNQWLKNNPEKRIRELNVNSNLKMEWAMHLIKRFGGYAIDHMNAKDLFEEHFETFLKYASILDRKHNTNLFEVYPEFNNII